MDMDQASVFLAGSILTMLGFIVVVAGVVIINNIIHTYWKSFGWSLFPASLSQEPPRFITPEEEAKIAPTLEKEKK